MDTEAWTGIFKVIEECGELQQVLGKLCVYPSGQHPDGENWRANLVLELADVLAAMSYFMVQNLTPEEINAISNRKDQKYLKFKQWGLSGVRKV